MVVKGIKAVVDSKRRVTSVAVVVVGNDDGVEVVVGIIESLAHDGNCCEIVCLFLCPATTTTSTVLCVLVAATVSEHHRQIHKQTMNATHKPLPSTVLACSECFCSLCIIVFFHS